MAPFQRTADGTATAGERTLVSEKKYGTLTVASPSAPPIKASITSSHIIICVARETFVTEITDLFYRRSTRPLCGEKEERWKKKKKMLKLFKGIRR
jgi:hypothetical protein